MSTDVWSKLRREKKWWEGKICDVGGERQDKRVGTEGVEGKNQVEDEAGVWLTCYDEVNYDERMRKDEM